MTKKYTFPKNVDVLYEIARDQVAQSVAERIAQNERHRKNDKECEDIRVRLNPTAQRDPGLNSFYDERNRLEREFYSKVMIGRRSDKTKNRYYLYYGGELGAGGFRTAQDAGNWYVNNGR